MKLRLQTHCVVQDAFEFDLSGNLSKLPQVVYVVLGMDPWAECLLGSLVCFLLLL